MAGTFEELDVALVCRETCIYDLLAGVKCQSPKWQTSLRALGVELSSPGLDPASLLIGSFHGVLSVVHKLCWADADRGCKPLEVHKCTSSQALPPTLAVIMAISSPLRYRQPSFAPQRKTAQVQATKPNQSQVTLGSLPQHKKPYIKPTSCSGLCPNLPQNRGSHLCDSPDKPHMRFVVHRDFVVVLGSSYRGSWPGCAD